MALGESCKIFNAEDTVERVEEKISMNTNETTMSKHTMSKLPEIRSKGRIVRPIDQSVVVLTVINLHYKKGEFQLSELLAPLEL